MWQPYVLFEEIFSALTTKAGTPVQIIANLKKVAISGMVREAKSRLAIKIDREEVLELNQVCYHVKTTHERCGPFPLVVLSQKRGLVTTLSGPTLSKTLSSKTLQVF